jgi:predicted dehydrogenase
MEATDKIELAALVSRNSEKAASFQQKYGAGKIYSSLEYALDDPEIEAVDLCLPNHLHMDAVIKSLRAGKHVLVEKPMANTVAECEAMNRAARETGKTLMVGQSRRFFDAVLKSQKILDDGEIGDLVSITAFLFAYLESPPTDWWREKDKAGGLMIPIWGSHIIDYILWMFKEMPERVHCEACSVNSNWEGEDETTILLGFSGDRHATIKMSWNTRLAPEEAEWDGKGKMLNSSDIIYERYIQGTKGTLHLNDETKLSKNGQVILDGEQKPGNFALQIIEFADAIRENREPLTGGSRIIDVIRVQEAALRAIT